MSTKQVMQLTDNAAKQVQTLLDKRGKESLGIRIGVKSGGCSGLKYFIEYWHIFLLILPIQVSVRF